MSRKGKVVLYVAVGVVGLSTLLLLLKKVNNNQYSSRIPEIHNSRSLSEPVKEQLSDALANARRNPSSENLGRLGMVYHSSANYAEAAQCYELALKRNKSEWIWNYYLGYLNIEMGDSESVIENYSKVIEKNPDVYHAWYYIGEQDKNLRKNDQAEAAFGEITSIQNRYSDSRNMTRYDYFPLGTYAMFQLARIYFEKGSMDLAEKTLQDIIQNNRSFGPAYRLLGNIYRVKGDIPLSNKYGTRANDLLVFSPPVDTLIDRLVLLSRSELYLLKKIDEAEKSNYPEWAMTLVSRAIHYIPDNKYLISKAIRISLMLGSAKQAITFTDQNIADFQDNFTEMNNMGTLFFQNRLYPQSMKYFTKAIDLKPDDTEVQSCMAICYWSAGDKQKSYEILNGLLENNRDMPDILADVTNLLFDLGEDEKAIGHLSRLKQMAPTNSKVQKMSGSLAEKSGDLQEAISMYESSFKSNPEDLSTIRYLGNLLVRQKFWDKAIRHYREALDYHPNDPYLLERLGTLLVTCPDPAHRDINEGRYFAERAFIHKTSHSTVLISAGRSLAIANAALGDKQHAYTIINMTISIARREKVSSDYVTELETIRQQLQSAD
jgi:tetratricopeptide (TPR) repeat protein